MTQNIPFFMHDLGQAELDSIAKVLAGPILTTGDTVRQFEEAFANYLGIKHILGVTSCTGAAHMAMLGLGIGEGDEVITTPMTFIATATAIIESGATPVMVDVEPETGNLDANLIEAAITPHTKAICPVHLYGQMVDMRAIRAIADKHRLLIVEDAAHCIEGTRDGVRPGELSDAVCFSFFATKNLTSGEGGALGFNDSDMYETYKLLRLHGMNKTSNDRYKEGYQHWDMTLLGWKYNMDNIQAALLLPQLERLERKWEMRRHLGEMYQELLTGIPDVTLPTILPGVRHAWHLFPVWIGAGRRDEVVQRLQAAKISSVVNYRTIHLLTYFREKYGFEPGDFPVAEKLGDAALSLPFYPGMPEEHVQIVAQTLREIMTSPSN